jgi:hypothetical protein
MSARRQSVGLIVAAAVLLCGSAVRLFAVPSAPINLTAIVVGSTVTLTWNSTTVQPLFGHRLEAGSASQLSNLARLLISPSTTFVASNVPAGTYFVRVRAVGVDGDSAPSNEVVVSVVGSSCTTPPGPPVNFTSTVNGSFIALNWSRGAGCPATKFILHAGSAPFSSNLAIMSLGDTLTFGASASAGTYYLRLFAENQYGSSSPSNEVMAVVGGAPSWLWGFVVDDSGGCIDGGTVEVISGQRVGERITQETPCSVWDYGGGFEFHGLTPGVEMIIRGSAPGYAPLVRSVTPYSGPQTAFLFVLSKIE